MSKIAAVPTNIITGALGVGKTTLILEFLKLKPSHERWAVLVNEFGEVGIDGSLLSSDHEQVFVREVPGGCMCCTSGLPMQIALNQLLAKAKPARLLIEPTGLGHPKEVLQTLCEPHYRDVLNVKATLTLLDARKLESTKWREHPVFQEQLQIADIIVTTKSDGYTAEHRRLLKQHLDTLGLNKQPLVDANTDCIDLNLLDLPQAKCIPRAESHRHGTSTAIEDDVSSAMPEVYKVANHGQGFYSFGWICSPARVFDHKVLTTTFNQFQGERLKAIMQTEQGPMSFNFSDEVLETSEHSYQQDSRLEFICSSKREAETMAELIEFALDLHNASQ